jgi:hypothetical protein
MGPNVTCNVDEIEINRVQKPEKAVAPRGFKKAGTVIRAECGTLVTSAEPV